MAKETFVINLLDDKEFDSLPYKDISDSLGIADPETGDAFIRKSGIKELDAATIQHEIQHLIGENKAHRDSYGIFHKKGRDIFSNIIPSIVGLAAAPFTAGLSLPLALGIPALAAGGTAAITQKNMSSSGQINPLGIGLSALGGALGAGAMGPGMVASPTGSYLGKLGSGLLGTPAIGTVKPATSGLAGSGGKLLGIGAAPSGSVSYPAGTPIGTTNMGTYSTLAPTGSPLSEVATTLKAGETLGMGAGLGKVASSYLPTVSSVSPYGTYGNPSSGFFGGTQPTLGQSLASSSVGNLLGSAIGNRIGSQIVTPKSNIAPTIQTPVEEAPKAGWLGNLTKKATDYLTNPEKIMGGALTLGSTMGKQPEYPTVDVESIRSSLLSGQGISPLGQQARQQLSQIMSAKPEELYSPATDAYYNAALRKTRESYTDAKKRLDEYYNLAGMYGSGEHLATVAKLEKELANVESDYAAQEEQRRFELSRNQQYSAIQQALNVDDATMKDLIGLTGLSMDQAAKKYAVAVDDVNEIRKALGTLGGQMLLGGNQNQTF